MLNIRFIIFFWLKKQQKKAEERHKEDTESLQSAKVRLHNYSISCR